MDTQKIAKEIADLYLEVDRLDLQKKSKYELIRTLLKDQEKHMPYKEGEKVDVEIEFTHPERIEKETLYIKEASVGFNRQEDRLCLVYRFVYPDSIGNPSNRPFLYGRSLTVGGSIKTITRSKK